jgi:hypothetical protein
MALVAASIRVRSHGATGVRRGTVQNAFTQALRVKRWTRPELSVWRTFSHAPSS